jgi:hypothetical protein
MYPEKVMMERTPVFYVPDNELAPRNRPHPEKEIVWTQPQ